jgi:beta-lactamase superfamily II metal-dependent hydrolase
MTEFYEIDFLEAGDTGNGDAIALRYGDTDGIQTIHVVDGGYSKDGEALRDHIRRYYGNPGFINHVVLTHPDGDHAAGLRTILQEFEVGRLWMNRPWMHVDELLPRFQYAYTRDGLVRRLRKNFPHTAELERIAIERGIPIMNAFSGTAIGRFLVLAPDDATYLDLIVASDKTPEPERKAAMEGTVVERVIRKVLDFVANWGEETLKGGVNATSRENEASIVQFACMAGDKILLTADAGVEALTEALEFATSNGLDVTRPDRFQVPHHGSRRNLSSEILDRWIGPKLNQQPESGAFSAIVSSNSKDPGHPRKAVVRALIHRGGNVITSDGGTIRTSRNAPKREGWSAITPLAYPQEMEE